MSEVQTAVSLLPQYDINGQIEESTVSNDELGQSEFLELMIAQLENQDPTNPQDDAQFIAELAQFSTVEGIEELNITVEDLASTLKSSQALEASALVGGSVTIAGNTESYLLWGELVSGSGEVPSGSTDVSLHITNSSGEVVENLYLGNLSGDVDFKWDGANLEVNGELVDVDYSKFETDEDGNIIPHAEGEYTFALIGNYDNVQTVFDLNVSKRVDSVTISDNNTIELNLLGGGTATMNDILAINAVY